MYKPRRSAPVAGRFLLMILVCLLSLPGLLAAQTTLTVGVYENKPLLFTDKDGQVAGLYIDLLKEIADHENWALEYVHAHWDTLLDLLRNGEIDLLPAIAYSEEREKTMSFNDETILVNWAEIYTSKNLTLSSLLELEGKRVAVKMSDIHFETLKELTHRFNINCRFIETDGYETIFEMLNSRYLDTGVVNRLFGRANMAEYNASISPLIFNPIELRFASPKGRHIDILTRIDNHLMRYKSDADSVYHLAMERWLSQESVSRLPRYARYVTVGAAIAFVLLFGLNLLLRHQVAKQTKTLRDTNDHLKKEISIRQQTMQELKKYARVVEASNDAIALFDRDHNHILVNNAYLKAFASTRETLQHTNLIDLVGQDFFATHLETAVNRCLKGEQVHVSTSYTHPGTAPKHWHIYLGPYQVSSDFILGYAVDIRDITQQVELENQLKNAQKMEAIGMLAGGVAHDLNNILSGIVSYPDMLLVDRPENDPMYGPLQTIKKSGKRAAAIVSDLLTLARRNVENMQPTNFNSLIRELLASPEYTLQKKAAQSVEVTLSLDEELLNVPGSPVHLSKCLMNLVINAFEAMPKGGVLSITTSNRYIEQTEVPRPEMKEGDYVMLSVTDTGMGMDQGTITHIFEPFYTSKVMGRSGSGLGMPLVWSAVQDHGGHITVESMPGAGSTFTLYFHATREKVTPRLERPLADYKGNGERVLVIDDVEEQRIFASAILVKLGYTVDTVERGEAAIDMVRKKSYDILILDMIMPGGIDGLTTYKRILDIRPGQKAIIASGYSNTEKINCAMALGAGPYVKKPYTVLSLAAALQDALHKNKANPNFS